MASYAKPSTKMTREQQDEFFDNLEQGLKEDFTIPKKKISETKKAAKDEKSGDEVEGEKKSPEKPKESGYNKKPPGAFKLEKRSLQKRKPEAKCDSEGESKRPRNVSDPLGLESMTFKEARGGRKYDPSGLNTFQDMYDRPLPKELLDLCVSTKCSLCELDFTSPIVAKSHFLGKGHMKRSNLFLQAWSARTKNPVPKKRSDFSAVEPYQDEAFCKTCNTPLSSKIVAVTHYQGKKHASALRNAGKINPNPVHPNGDRNFGIGESFRPPKPIEKPEDLEDGEVFDKDWTAAPNSNLSKQPEDGRRSFCLPCKLYFSSDEYPLHVASVEHKSKAFSQMGSEKDGRKFYCSVCMVQCDAEETYDAHLKSAGHRSKIKEASDVSTSNLLSQLRDNPQSIYRCNVCDIQMTGQVDYDVHVAGKKHRAKAGLPALPTTPNAPTPSEFRCEICMITTTDQSGLDMHFAGKKHKKKASQVGQSFLNNI